MIQVYDILYGFDVASKLADVMERLPQWRREKAMAYRTDIDRFLCGKSFLMLEEMLRGRFAPGRCPEFSFGENGKPYFREYPDIFFNISHCRKGIACAVSDAPVGIDIEEIQYDGAVASLVFNSDELESINASSKPDVKFTELWTRKESLLKLTGEGITDDLKDILAMHPEVRFSTRVNRTAGYVVTLAEQAI